MNQEVDLLCSPVQEYMVFDCGAVIDHMITVIATGTELNCVQCHLSLHVKCRWSYRELEIFSLK
jgi:hypothetical protein